MIEATTFGTWLRQCRQALDLTQAELAAQVGCTRITIAKIEAGERRPSKQVADRLAEVLTVPPAERAAFLRLARSGPAPTPAPQAAAPPAPGAPALPALPTSFVGRAQEVAAARTLLGRADVRLVTLLGPPGIGKTRLALEVAAALRPDFTQGVWWVPLAPIQDPALVPATIAGVLGLQEGGGTSLRERLVVHLRDKQLLLVLDNFEQVAAVAPLLSEALAQAPRLKILVTSRAALDLQWEHRFPVPPLAVPDPAQLLPPDELVGVEAVSLFVARVRAIQPGFALTAANAEAVAALCTRLEGLPLAIELAAARSNLFPPAALLARLGERLTLLSRRAPDLPPRQQTLRGAIDWSYDLLTAAERALFRSLGVFVGGCTIEAAERVVSGQWSVVSDPVSGNQESESRDSQHTTPNTQHAADPHTSFLIPHSSVLEGLASLVDKSLLQQTEGVEGEPRFRMLELIREYALERLAADGEEAIVRQRHTAYYLAFATEADPQLRGARQQVWLARLEQEHDNLRAALRWTLSTQEGVQAGRLGAALWRFWLTRGHVREGRQWLEAIMAYAGQIPPAVMADLYNGSGGMAWAQSDYEQATAFFSRRLELCQALGDEHGVSTAISNLGIAASNQGRYADALAYFERARAIQRRLNNPWNMAVVLANMALSWIHLGDYEQAAQLSQESLALRRELGDTAGMILSLMNWGLAVLHQGDTVRALALHQETLALALAVGDKRNIALAHLYLGTIARQQGNMAQARIHYTQCLALFQEVGDRLGLARALSGCAALAAAAQRDRQAARLLGAVEQLRPALAPTLMAAERAGYDEARSAAQARLGEAAFAAAWEAGQALSPEMAVAEALAPPDDPDATAPIYSTRK